MATDWTREIRVRIKASGQVLEMAPIAARALLNGGTAELVDETEAANLETKPASIETAAVEGSAQTAVARDQHKHAKKTRSAR